MKDLGTGGWDARTAQGSMTEPAVVAGAGRRRALRFVGFALLAAIASKVVGHAFGLETWAVLLLLGAGLAIALPFAAPRRTSGPVTRQPEADLASEQRSDSTNAA